MSMYEYEEDELETYSVSELCGTDKNIYPVVYALKIFPFRDFYYTAVREAFFVGISIDDENKPSHEVIFLEDNGGEILVDREGDFPYNSIPTMAMFVWYEGAKEKSREINNALLAEYSKTHFDFEVDDVKKELERAYKEEDAVVYKGINDGNENADLFSTTYVKTRFKN